MSTIHPSPPIGNGAQSPEWWRGQLVRAAELLADEIERLPAECISRETVVAVAMLGRRRMALEGARR